MTLGRRTAPGFGKDPYASRYKGIAAQSWQEKSGYATNLRWSDPNTAALSGLTAVWDASVFVSGDREIITGSGSAAVSDDATYYLVYDANTRTTYLTDAKDAAVGDNLIKLAAMTIFAGSDHNDGIASDGLGTVQEAAYPEKPPRPPAVVRGDLELGALALKNTIDSFSLISSGIITYGTFTPTFSGASNLDATPTATGLSRYIRVGSTVTVSGRFSADPTAAGSAQFEMTLPIASNFADTNGLAGVAFCGAVAGQGAQIRSSGPNDTAVVTWIAVDLGNNAWCYTYTYTII